VYDPFSNCLYVAERSGGTVRKITLAGVVTTLASGLGSLRNGITVDPAGNVYITADAAVIKKITPGGTVTTFAGSGAAASTDGTGTNAAFNNAYGIVCDPTGNYLYVSDASTNKIRRVTLAGAVVTTIAGTGGGGSLDGAALSATFATPTGLAVDQAGNLYIASGDKIRKLSPNGIVTTVAGSGSSTVVNGVGTNASFQTPNGIVVDPVTGNLYVTDWYGYTIRKITPAGVVTTIAGQVGVASVINGLGSAATFNQPTALAIDPAGNLYATDFGGHMVRRISLVTTLHNVIISTSGFINAPAVSTLALNISSINGQTPIGLSTMISTVAGLGTTGYISTASLTSSLVGAQFLGSTVFLSTAIAQISSLSTVNIQATTGYVSSLTVDSLQIGSNAAFISLGDSIATSLSTIIVRSGVVNASQLIASTISTTTLFTQSTLLGSSSLQTAIQFFGLSGNYTNTVLAEQSTSGTSQEFLVFRGSSASDRIRMQTTGNIVFEPGVTARMWPNTPSNVTPALIINTASNIGILTATPAFPLDVAGIVRAQFMSTLNLQVCTINGAAPGTGSGGGTTFVGSTIFLSSAQGFISSLTVNALTIGATPGFTVMGDVIATSMSTINLQVSTINGGLPGSGSSSAFNGSTISVSTLQLFDPALTFSSIGNLSVRSSLLLYNSTIVAGARQVQSQMFTF
jgi:sugar lactone lactonase YvrE